MVIELGNWVLVKKYNCNLWYRDGGWFGSRCFRDYADDEYDERECYDYKRRRKCNC